MSRIFLQPFCRVQCSCAPDDFAQWRAAGCLELAASVPPSPLVACNRRIAQRTAQSNLFPEARNGVVRVRVHRHGGHFFSAAFNPERCGAVHISRTIPRRVLASALCRTARPNSRSASFGEKVARVPIQTVRRVRRFASKRRSRRPRRRHACPLGNSPARAEIHRSKARTLSRSLLASACALIGLARVSLSPDAVTKWSS